MDQNFLFRWIWRFNAVAIAAFLILLGWSFLPYYMLRAGSTIETIETVDRGAPGDHTKPPAKLRLFLDYAREGRREMVFALAPEAKMSGKFAIRPDGESAPGTDTADTARVANYLFVDPATGTSRWLFPTNEQVISATDYVAKNMLNAAPVVLNDPVPAIAVVYDVKPLQPSGAPAARAKYQVYVSKLDGTNLTKLFDDLDEVATFVPAADNTIFATYKLKGRHMVATVSLADFKVVMTKDLTEYAPK